LSKEFFQKIAVIGLLQPTKGFNCEVVGFAGDWAKSVFLWKEINSESG